MLGFTLGGSGPNPYVFYVTTNKLLIKRHNI